MLSRSTFEADTRREINFGSDVMAVTTRLGPRAAGISSGFTWTTLTNGNMNSLLAIGCSEFSTSTTVGNRYEHPFHLARRSPERWEAVTSRTPGSVSP